MKHLKLYSDFLSEGLIKTTDVNTAVKKLESMFRSNNFKNMIFSANGDDDGHISIGIVNNGKTMEFSEKLASLLNVLGYYISNITIVDNSEENFSMPKSMDEFLNAMKKHAKDKSVREFHIIMEPKFEKPEKEKFTYLYHVTEKKHLEKILKIGLVPRSKSKLSYHPERIYLANNSALSAIFDKYKEFVKEPILLKVNVEGLSIYPDINACFGAYFTTENIGPDKIKVLKESPKQLVNKYNNKFSKEFNSNEISDEPIENFISNLLHTK